MGKIEDLMVYSKLIILVVISITLMNNANTTLPVLFKASGDFTYLSVLIVASLTFVAYEGFQLVINAVNEMEDPEINIPRAIYSAIIIAILIYVIISLGAILAIPFESIIKNKEYALAAGADQILGQIGSKLVILGALLATSSAISGTIFGASRQMSVIARDGYFPKILSFSKKNIPIYSITTMSLFAFLLILAGNLEVILEFGSITFLIVSLLMGFANHKIRKETNANPLITISSIISLASATFLIIYYNFSTQIKHLYFSLFIYIILTFFAYLFSRKPVKR